MNKDKIAEDVQRRLFELQDKDYRDFHARLIPTVDTERIIGVRTPVLRAFARAYAKTEEAGEFMKLLPHDYYEENNLHGFLIEEIRNYEQCLDALEAFLPYVDNWATCDMTAPKVFKKHLPEFLVRIRSWIKSGQTYTVRYGIGMLMRFYLDEAFCPEYLEWVSEVSSEEYYVKMMVAWYFATALAKQYDAAIPYIEEKRLERWTHNKAVQKAIESKRISGEQKAYLRTLRQ